MRCRVVKYQSFKEKKKKKTQYFCDPIGKINRCITLYPKENIANAE